MPIHDLACILVTAEKPSRLALGQAIALARGYGAKASVLVAAPKVVTHSRLIVSSVGDLVRSENARVLAGAEATAADAKADLSKAGAEGAVELCHESFQDILLKARQYSLCHDLSVIDRPDGALDRSEVIFEEALFAAGNSVFLPAPDRSPVEKVERIALAWDGSPYAARAFSFALLFFAGLKSADIVTVTGEKNLTDMVPAAQIAAHAERHGAKTKVIELKLEKDGVSRMIDEYAASVRADLIVMGAFGRSRLREFTFGGVTRDLSHHSRTSLLLSH